MQESRKPDMWFIYFFDENKTDERTDHQTMKKSESDSDKPG